MATPARDPACYSAVKRAQAGSPALGQLHHSKGHDPKQLRLKLGGLQGQIGQISSQMRCRPPQKVKLPAHPS